MNTKRKFSGRAWWVGPRGDSILCVSAVVGHAFEGEHRRSVQIAVLGMMTAVVDQIPDVTVSTLERIDAPGARGFSVHGAPLERVRAILSAG